VLAGAKDQGLLGTIVVKLLAACFKRLALAARIDTFKRAQGK
jgi:hypothetical protein